MAERKEGARRREMGEKGCTRIRKVWRGEEGLAELHS